MTHMPAPADIRHLVDEWHAQGQPPQPGVAWQRNRWLERYPELAATFNVLPDELDRAAVREIVLSKPLTNQGMFEAMIATYAWGWSLTGVGISRAARVLNAGPEQVGPRLLGARTELLADGPLAGYWALARAHRIPGLGPAFGTKFLYFCSPEDGGALILDNLVAAWLRDRNLLAIGAYPFVRARYASYIDAMSAWAQDLHVSADQLEELIFRKEAQLRGLSGWGA
jgi:hypothetical protein